jgi:hypothetical protein
VPVAVLECKAEWTGAPPEELGSGCFGRAVICDMRLRCLPSMLRRVFMVTSGEVCMMRCRFVFSCFMMLCGFLMMSCRMFMMLCCLAVMLYCFY